MALKTVTNRTHKKYYCTINFKKTYNSTNCETDCLQTWMLTWSLTMDALPLQWLHLQQCW